MNRVFQTAKGETLLDHPASRQQTQVSINQETDATRRHAIILTLAVWLASFAISTLRDLVDPPPNFLLVTTSRLAFAGIAALLCYPLHLILRKYRTKSFFVRLAIVIPAIVATAIAYTEGALQLQRAITGAQFGLGAGWRFYNTVYWSVFFLAWSALYLALLYSQELAKHAERARIADMLAHDAQLRALRYQIDPHFLFNTLNSVSALVVTGRTEEAEAMLTKLSTYFRATTTIDPHAMIALTDELALQRLFLDIEQVRFPDLTIDMDIPIWAREIHVPALMLQPIFENAVKFGVGMHNAPTHIAMRCYRDDHYISIAVENHIGTRANEPGTATGLRNIKDRLHAVYGEGAALHANVVGGSLFRTTISIPVERGR